MRKRALHRKRIIALLLSGMLITGLFPVSASAEETAAATAVSEERVTEEAASEKGGAGTSASEGAGSEGIGSEGTGSEGTGSEGTGSEKADAEGNSATTGNAESKDPADAAGKTDASADTAASTTENAGTAAEKNTEKDAEKDKTSLDTVESSKTADKLKAADEESEYDGDVSWYNETATSYVLYDAEDLLGLASLVNAGNSFEGKTVSLGKDISLADLEEWIPIGYNDSTPYEGRFCGNGHTVSDMQVEVSDSGGLFGHLYGAEISDLTVAGSVLITGMNGGGIAGDASVGSVIHDCVSYVTISAASSHAVANIGGIVGKMSIHAQVKDCVNYGTITCRSTSSRAIGGIAGGVLADGISGCTNYGNITGGYNIGGIAGTVADAYNSPKSCVIENCWNMGRVTSNLTENGSGSASMAGGIVGTLEETASITMCVNQGTVNGGKICGAGGIAGKLLGTITYSYNSGTVSNNNSSADACLGGLAGRMDVSDSSSAEIRYSYNVGTVQPGEDFASLMVGNLAGSRASGTAMWKVYGLEDDSQSLIGGDGSADGAEGKTAEAFKETTFMTNINQASYAIFVSDSGISPINQGYPVLYWQREDDTPCTITVEQTTNGTIEASETTVPYGSYIELTAYPVAGYKLNNYTVNGISTSSAKILVTQDITVGAKFVKASSGTLVFPESDDYTLQVSKTGFIYQDGTYETVTDLPVSDGDKVYEGDKLYITVEFTAEPEDTSKEYTAEITGTYLKKSASGYYQVTGSSGGKVTFTVTTNEITRTWENLADTSWYNESDTEFTLTTANELAGFALLVRDGTDDFSGKTVALGADISLADPKGGLREWLPIGTADYSKATAGSNYFAAEYYHAFSGTFEGNSHTISDLYINDCSATEKLRGLFGAVFYGVIQDVTVEGELQYAKSYNTGSIYSESISLQGGVAALLYGAEIRSCVSRVKICNTLATEQGSGSGKASGGIAGKIMEQSTVSRCTYEGAIDNQTNVHCYLGGIVGNEEEGSTIEYCKNMADITSCNSFVYGGGIVGNGLGNVYACVNYGNLSSSYKAITNPYFADILGGIASIGTNITACANKGNIQGGDNTGVVGGIAGEMLGVLSSGDNYVGEINNCYNSGTLSSTYTGTYGSSSVRAFTLEIGGICGLLYSGFSVTVSNCYNVGKIGSLPEEGVSILSGSICGRVGSKQFDDVFENCYYLFRTSDYAVHQMELCDGISMFYAADMTEADSGFAEMLNQGGYEYFCEDDKGANNGYPLLFFEQVIGIQIMKQPEQTTYTAFDTFAPAGMEVAVVYSNGDTATIGDYSYSKEPLTVDTKQVTITYQDGGGTTRKASVPVTVVPYDLTGKTVSVTLDQTSYDYADGAFVIPVIQSAADDMGREMEEYTDYEVTYEKNQEVGTATLILTGTGNYTGTTSAEFEIQRRTIQGMTATLSKTSYTYNGKACCPTVTIDGLEEGKDYTVSYQNNQVAGTAKAVITGIGNYTGEITETFTIKKATQSITGVSGSYSKAYSTSGMTLKATAKGKISYSSGNTKVAKINATTGKITYVGAGTVTITIKAAATSGYNAATKTVKLTVTRASQKITAKKSSASYTASALSKKAASFSIGAKTSGNGKLTYKVSSTPSGASKYITVRSTGKVTLKKGAKKGTYKILVTAAKTNQYNKSTKYITIQVK